MTINRLMTGAMLLAALLLGGCMWGVGTDQPGGGSADQQAAVTSSDLALEWRDGETLAIGASGYAPGETVMMGVEVTREERNGGSVSRSSQQTANSVSAGADGSLSHTITIRAQPGTSVRVTLTDQSGQQRTAETTVP